MGYKFFFIKTYHTLDWLEQLLYSVGYATNQISLKVIRDNMGKETDRTLAFLDETVYNILIHQNRNDLHIEPWKTMPNLHPKLDSFTYNFCIPFPDGGTTVKDKIYLKQIEMKLSPFIAQGVIPHDSFKITVPVTSRERNETRGIAFIEFHVSINRDILATLRYLLDGSYWDNHISMRCSWARVRTFA